jgi:L-methionine (R)-S-oxide reductase
LSVDVLGRSPFQRHAPPAYLSLFCSGGDNDEPALTASQPHADAANFSGSLGKPAAYASVLSSLESLVSGQRNWVANTANAASLLWHMFHALPAPSAAVNWSGFYVLDPSAPSSRLILGPFMGKVACQTIRIGQGVCGAAADGPGQTVLVTDVHDFPGHIACDGDSQSEIVVPIRSGGKVFIHP